MTVLQGFDADVWITGGAPLAVSNEAMTQIAISANSTTYQTTTHKFWDMNSSYTLQSSPDGTTWSNANNLMGNFSWVSGMLILPYNAGSTQFRFSGSYFAASQVDECHTWELTVTAETQDTTKFQGGGWKRYTPTTRHASGKIGTFIVNDLLSAQLGNRVAILLYMSKTAGSMWNFYGFISQADPKNDANALITDDVSFVSDGQVIFYATS